MKLLSFLTPEGRAASKALALVTTERRRQIEAEGWTHEHDDEHCRGDLALAAACYAIPPLTRQQKDHRSELSNLPPGIWPWSRAFWKPSPSDRKRELVKAGALILAELERELRRDAAMKGRT